VRVELTDSALIGDLEVLFEKRAQIDALIADRICAADLRGTTVASFGRTVRAFLVEELYVDKRAASRKMRSSRSSRLSSASSGMVTMTRARGLAWGTLPSGARIGPETARRLACDAGVIPIVLGADGEVHDQGWSRRVFSPATRRAAWLRDNGRCAFPNCQSRPVQCHHIKHWAHGGCSDLDNAAWLCTFHHRLVHEGDWSMCRERDGSYTWTGPQGQRRSTAKVRPDPPWAGT